MKIPHKIEWYFWHVYYPDYAERMQVMAEYAKHSEMHKYYLRTMELVSKD